MSPNIEVKEWDSSAHCILDRCGDPSGDYVYKGKIIPGEVLGLQFLVNREVPLKNGYDEVFARNSKAWVIGISALRKLLERNCDALSKVA